MSRKYNLLSLFKSIRLSILIPFSVLIALTLCIMILISLNYTEKEVLNNSIDYTARLTSQVHGDIDSYISYMDNISALVALNQDVRQYMEADEDNAELRQGIVTQLSTVLETRNDISNIGIISNDGTYIFNNGSDILNENSNYQQQDWFKHSFSTKKTYLSTSHVQNIIENKYTWVITLSRPIYRTGSKTECGVFFIDLNYKAIRNLCEKNSLGTDSYVFILDQKGNIIYHPQQQLIYNNLKTEPIAEILECDDEYFTINKQNTKMLYTISRNSQNGWLVVGAVNTSELIENKASTQRLYCFLCLGLLGIAIIISHLISSAITRPIKRLSTSMQKVQSGNFETAAVQVYNEAELGDLARTFNSMITRIDYLMRQNTYEQEQKRISEMKALQAQINPHFLYNTLDSIIWMAEDGQSEDVVTMTSSLAKLLRQSISNEHTFVAISEEISYTRNYLTIQKMRYKDKLSYSIDISPDIMSAPIIKLVVQPIVENAIYHGIKPKAGNGSISIRGYAYGSDICLEIEDDGVGMSQDVIEHLFDSNKANISTRKSVGILNVQNRLQMQYGKQYGLVYSSKPGRGTLAKIIIPASVTGGNTDEA